MKFCQHCGNEVLDEAKLCPKCGCSPEKQNPNAGMQENGEDKVSIGLCVLAALIPLFGIIYWPVKHKESPKRAMACGIIAIVSWIVSFVVVYTTMSSLFNMLL